MNSYGNPFQEIGTETQNCLPFLSITWLMKKRGKLKEGKYIPLSLCMCYELDLKIVFIRKEPSFIPFQTNTIRSACLLCGEVLLQCFSALLNAVQKIYLFFRNCIVTSLQYRSGLPAYYNKLDIHNFIPTVQHAINTSQSFIILV